MAKRFTKILGISIQGIEEGTKLEGSRHIYISLDAAQEFFRESEAETKADIVAEFTVWINNLALEQVRNG